MRPAFVFTDSYGTVVSRVTARGSKFGWYADVSRRASGVALEFTRDRWECPFCLYDPDGGADLARHLDECSGLAAYREAQEDGGKR